MVVTDNQPGQFCISFSFFFFVFATVNPPSTPSSLFHGCLQMQHHLWSSEWLLKEAKLLFKKPFWFVTHFPQKRGWGEGILRTAFEGENSCVWSGELWNELQVLMILYIPKTVIPSPSHSRHCWTLNPSCVSLDLNTLHKPRAVTTGTAQQMLRIGSNQQL